MQQTITIPTEDPIEAAVTKINLEKLAKNLSIDNLKFLAELSTSPNINKKLSEKKTLIKMYL